jgi:bifunctional DNA-binding transcriptional regulator/antitoxin component of YhaV-PrlF toxin-antitoxin module
MIRPLPVPGASGPSPGSGPLATRRGRTTAQAIVAGLALPWLPPPGEARPLPVPSLRRLPRDASMVYDVGSVDASGRIASQPVIAAAGWHPGDRLDLLPAASAIMLRPSSTGLWSVPPRGGICLPAQARHRHGIARGDRVLLAAAREYSLVIVYPASAIDEMLTRYHEAHATEGDEHE